MRNEVRARRSDRSLSQIGSTYSTATTVCKNPGTHGPTANTSPPTAPHSSSGVMPTIPLAHGGKWHGRCGTG